MHVVLLHSNGACRVIKKTLPHTPTLPQTHTHTHTHKHTHPQTHTRTHTHTHTDEHTPTHTNTHTHTPPHTHTHPPNSLGPLATESPCILKKSVMYFVT